MGAFGRQIGWRIVAGQIAPALKRTARDRRDADQFGAEHQGAAPDPVISDPFLQPDKLLTRQHGSLENPVDRAAGEKLCLSLGPHPGDMLAWCGAIALLLPCLQIFRRFGADAEFHEIDVFDHDPDIGR